MDDRWGNVLVCIDKSPGGLIEPELCPWNTIYIYIQIERESIHVNLVFYIVTSQTDQETDNIISAPGPGRPASGQQYSRSCCPGCGRGNGGRRRCR